MWLLPGTFLKRYLVLDHFCFCSLTLAAQNVEVMTRALATTMNHENEGFTLGMVEC